MEEKKTTTKKRWQTDEKATPRGPVELSEGIMPPKPDFPKILGETKILGEILGKEKY